MERDEKPQERSRGGTAKFLRIALPVAAGALLVVMLPRFFRDSNRDVPRFPAQEPGRSTQEPESRERAPAEPSTPASGVVGLFPFGTFSEPPPQFIWTRDANASTYRFELLDESNQVLFWTETADTTLALPEDHSGWSKIAAWRVVPLKDGSEGGASDPMRIRIDPSSGP